MVQEFVAWFGGVFFLSFVQWSCVQFMATFCAPWSFYGLIANMFNVGSPVCHAVNKIQLSIVEHSVIVWASAVPLTTALLFKLKISDVVNTVLKMKINKKIEE